MRRKKTKAEYDAENYAVACHILRKDKNPDSASRQWAIKATERHQGAISGTGDRESDHGSHLEAAMRLQEPLGNEGKR
jgi:hypothetical protein